MSPSRNATTLSERQATNLVVARLFDYFGLRTDWQRRLWNPGTVTVLQETLEAIDLLDSGHLRTATVIELVKTARRRAGPDLGVGTAAVRSTMEATLGKLHNAPDDRVARHQLEDLLTNIESNYLARCSTVLTDDAEALAPESASRLLAGHLLGMRYSPTTCIGGQRGLQRTSLRARSPNSSARQREWSVARRVLGRYSFHSSHS